MMFCGLRFVSLFFFLRVPCLRSLLSFFLCCPVFSCVLPLFFIFVFFLVLFSGLLFLVFYSSFAPSPSLALFLIHSLLFSSTPLNLYSPSSSPSFSPSCFWLIVFVAFDWVPSPLLSSVHGHVYFIHTHTHTPTHFTINWHFCFTWYSPYPFLLLRTIVFLFLPLHYFPV